MARALPVSAAAGALVVVLATGALAAASTRQLSHVQQRAEDRSSALAAGRQIAVDVADYDYQQIDADFTRVTNESTGSFKQEFATQAAGVRDAIVAAKAVAKAEVVSAGVTNASGTSAQVVVALNRTITNTQAPKGQTSAIGLQLFLVRIHGHWLASQVKPL